MEVLKAWDYAQMTFRSEELQIASIKAEIGTGKHSFSCFQDGYVSWLCIMAMYHGYVPWPCIMAMYLGHVSWLCIMAMYHGFLSWLCIMAMSIIYIYIYIMHYKKR